MDIKFKVTNQKLEHTNTDYLVNHAHNYHQIKIDFTTPDWENRTIFIILKNNNEAYRFNYNREPIIVPGAIITGNNFKISAYGVDTNQNRITTNELGILLHQAGYTTEISEIPEEEVDIIADIYQRLDLKLDISSVDDVLDINSSNPVENKIITGHLNDKSDKGHKHLLSDVSDFPGLANVATSGSYNDLTDKPTIETLGGVINVIKQGTPDDDYFATYIITQAGSQAGVKINIPKDKFLKSCEVKTCTVEDVPEGFHIGDIYLDMVFNVESGERHQYVLLNALIDVYTADNVTLELVNGQFKVKNKGIGSTQLSDDVNLKLGYAETFNNSACKNITSNDLVYWNAKQDTTNLTTEWGSTLSDMKYPSEKLVKNYVDSCVGNIQEYVNR